MMRKNEEEEREKSKTMTSDADDRRSYCKVRIALSYKLTKQCGKRFHVHQHKDFERDCNRSIRVKQRTSL